MTALAANNNVDAMPRGRNVYDLVGSAQVWAGSLVGIVAASGLMQAWADTATDIFVGIALENALEGAQIGNSPTRTVDVVPVNDEGFIKKNIPVASAAQTDVGKEVYCTTDNIEADCVLDAGATSRAIGRIIRWRSAADVDVEIYSAAEWSVRYIQATT